MQVIVLDRPKVLAPLLRFVFKIKKSKAGNLNQT